MTDDTRKFPAARTCMELAAIAFAAFTCYAGTFHYPFVFDDYLMFVKEDTSFYLKDAAAVWAFNPSRFINFYSLAINYWIGGKDTFGYHLVNFAIHVACALAVYWITAMLAKRYGGGLARRWLPLFVALIFAAHPIQPQAVTYIWQRATALSAMFYLGAIGLYLKSAMMKVERPGGYWKAVLALSAVTATAAMFTKQVCVTLPAAIVIADYFFVSGSWRALREALPRLALFIPAFAVIPLFTALGLSQESRDIVTRAGRIISRHDYFLTQINVVGTYIRLLFYPAGQNLDYDYPVARSLADCWMSLAFLLTLAGLAYYLRNRNRIASFGIVFFFLGLSVESSIFPLEDVIFEHRVYLPSFGMILAFGAMAFQGLEKLVFGAGTKKWAAVAIILAAVLPLSLATRLRNEVWKDHGTIWRDVVAKSPNKVRGYHQLGLMAVAEGRLADAEQWYRLAVNTKSSAFARMELGGVLEKSGRPGEALAEYRRAVELEPSMVRGHIAIGDHYMKTGDFEKAARAFINAVNANPELITPRLRLGGALAQGGWSGDAIRAYRSVIKIAPYNLEANEKLAEVYKATGEQELSEIFQCRVRSAKSYKTKGGKLDA
ncbi:MAG: tetratricopeptide repeat protein [Nitrospinae bacterium]|nr:tetratricopeptide repeat protein [Nitrospinota bacterium]